MAAKTKSARKTKKAGTVRAKKSSSKKSKPGMMARVTAAVKNLGANRAKRRAKAMHFIADNMIVGKQTAQSLAKKADARAARRQKAARAATRKAR